MIFQGIEETLHIAENDVKNRRKPGRTGICVDRTENLNEPDGEEYWEERPIVLDRLQGLSCVSIRKTLKSMWQFHCSCKQRVSDHFGSITDLIVIVF